jgi:hypothetical protein
MVRRVAVREWDVGDGGNDRGAAWESARTAGTRVAAAPETGAAALFQPPIAAMARRAEGMV